MLKIIIKFFLDNKLIAWIMLSLFIILGLVTAPFSFTSSWFPRSPITVDAIPNIGENQQIVFTKWPGQSPKDIEDQITYPLTSALLGIPGIKNIRSNSMFGFSSIHLIFEDDIDFYWSRSRIVEKFNSIPSQLLPLNVKPEIGPDATGLGQIFWYTLEGRDSTNSPTGGWDLQELRSIQDFYVKNALQSSGGVSEVASIGGFVKEYQIDVIPEKMKAYGVSLNQVMKAIKESNLDIGAQTLEINMAEYFVRGLGYIKSVEDIEQSVVTVSQNIPIRVKDIALVHLGPASRRGILDKSGTPAVGGSIIARYGTNPIEVITNIKKKINDIKAGLPSKTLSNGTTSQITIVPFYDRTQLINETIGTLEEALTLEVLITIIVVILMLLNLKSSLLVSASLPVAVLMCFIAMRYFGIDANIVSLAGIAIAVGTMVDMGIVLTESMISQLKSAPSKQSIHTTIYQATIDVAPAVLTAVSTTIVSFLPVFTMQSSEGKLFLPLAYTKSFALIASIILSITVIPAISVQLFQLKNRKKTVQYFINSIFLVLSITLLFTPYSFFGFFGFVVGVSTLFSLYFKSYKSEAWLLKFNYFQNIIYALIIAWVLAKIWMPLGVEKSVFSNYSFVLFIIGTLIGSFSIIIQYYSTILSFLISIKYLFISFLLLLIYAGYSIFITTQQEFMPSLDEGSFLLMPSSMPHAGMQINEANLRLLDLSVSSIPEVKTVVGKAGRIESSLDPAPMSMYENIISYKSEYKIDENGRKLRFKVNEDGEFELDKFGELIPSKNGLYYRQWRDHIKSSDDIWKEIVKASNLPGLTSAPKLQPIETRLLMLQTGMRAPMGIKIFGSDLKTIELFSQQIEQRLKEVDGVKRSAVYAEKIVGKPYLLIDIKREKIAQYGLSIVEIQTQIQAAIGGKILSSSVEGRERYNLRVRYPLELRNDPEKIKSIYISTSNGTQISLGDLVNIKYEQGPQSIKSEDGFLVKYVLFDKNENISEIALVDKIKAHFENQIATNSFLIPNGVTYKFAGNYEQQVRANNRFKIVIPISLLLIFLLLYFQFKSVTISLFVFSGVFVAFSGGFIMIWLYSQPWFMNIDLLGINFRTLFHIDTIYLSVAVWVGFLALFGIATDDGVLIATFLKKSFSTNAPNSIEAIKKTVIEGGSKRVKPAMMTTATTILALLPILTSTGKGAEIMLPMAIPSFGGMALNIITMFTVPVLYYTWQELKFKWHQSKK